MSWNFDTEGNEISDKIKADLDASAKKREEFAVKMRSLIGKTVKDVLGNDLLGFVVVFDDETMLTAIDSEFGDNAFSFVEKSEVGVV